MSQGTEGSVSTEGWEVLMLGVALLTVAASAYFYVAGVLASDRLVSRSAVGLFVVFGLATAVMLWRVLS